MINTICDAVFTRHTTHTLSLSLSYLSLTLVLRAGSAATGACDTESGNAAIATAWASASVREPGGTRASILWPTSGSNTTEARPTIQEGGISEEGDGSMGG